MHQKLCGYKVEEKMYVGLSERKRLNITGLVRPMQSDLPAESLNKTLTIRNEICLHYCLTFWT